MTVEFIELPERVDGRIVLLQDREIKCVSVRPEENNIEEDEMKKWIIEIETKDYEYKMVVNTFADAEDFIEKIQLKIL